MEIKVHDYRTANKRWGHDIVSFGVREEVQRKLFRKNIVRKYLDMKGFGNGVKSGDKILVNMKDGSEKELVVSDVDYYQDPSDHFSCKVYL